MNERPPEIKLHFDERVMALSGGERVAIGCAMFDAMRAMVIASLPQDLTEEEFKRQLFERIYGAPMEDFLSGAVTDADLAR